MTPKQLRALRAAPLGSIPNRLAVALALVERTQTDVCEEAGISKARMSLLVNGNYKTVSIDEAGRIARAFGCAIEDLFPAVSNAA